MAASVLKCKDADDVNNKAENGHDEQSLVMNFWWFKHALKQQEKTISKQTNNISTGLLPYSSQARPALYGSRLLNHEDYLHRNYYMMYGHPLNKPQKRHEQNIHTNDTIHLAKMLPQLSISERN